MSLLGDAAQVQEDAFEVEIVKPEQATGRNANKVVPADRLARFVIFTQLQSEFPIIRKGRGIFFRFLDFLQSFLDPPSQLRIAHVRIGIDRLEAYSISSVRSPYVS